jgi:hypothetical protein
MLGLLLQPYPLGFLLLLFKNSGRLLCFFLGFFKCLLYFLVLTVSLSLSFGLESLALHIILIQTNDSFCGFTTRITVDWF